MIEKISLRMPPNSMFQPVTSEFRNNITFTEFLLGVLKKLNETITEVNNVSQYITDFDSKYQELLREFEDVKNEFDELEQKFDGLEKEIVDAVSVKLTEFYAKVETEISIAVNYLKAYSDTNDQALSDRIDQIVLGDIQVIDPTTGMLEPLQEVINNIAGTGRDALTSTEYDTLEITATTYDGYQISAYDYDYHGKAILMA